MYKIYRFERRFNNKVFKTYELARQYLRKWMRKEFSISDHAPLKSGGFSIVKATS